jgi:hypothetical protein
LHPFLCYRTKLKQGIAVTLEDEFDAGSFQGSGVKLFCNPAERDGDAADVRAPLTAYKIAGQHGRRRRVAVANQIISFAFPFDTRKTDSLLVPNAISAIDGPMLADHYRCLKVSFIPGGPGFPRGIRIGLADQYGPRTVIVKKPAQLCVPTAMDGSPIEDPARHLMCYAVRAIPRAKATGIAVSNDFGDVTLNLRNAVELCVPSTLLPPG